MGFFLVGGVAHDVLRSIGGLNVINPKVYLRGRCVRRQFAQRAQRIAEQGLPGYQAITWIGFYGPAHLPSAIAERLNALARASVNSAAARPWFKDNGADPGDMDQKQYAAFVASELGKWKNTVARAGVSVD
ncbi:hypothetical protein ET532_014460 [Verminephrobacter sp. Larva24]|nr:hypothetical protein ET532_014460 [Verminephrobacter sp. Larva24]